MAAAGPKFKLAEPYDTSPGKKTFSSPAKTCLECGAPIKAGRIPKLKFCSVRCRLRSQEKPCPGCGETKIRPGIKLCVRCTDAAHAERRRKLNLKLEELWSEGLNAKEIAPIVGLTWRSVNGSIVRARKEGFDIPRRGKAPPRTVDKTLPPRNHREAAKRVQTAVQTGRLTKPGACERCGVKGPVDGHHPDYSKWLEVEWICRGCHMQHHADEPAAA